MVWLLIFLFLDALVNFLPVHGDFLRRVDADAHLVPFDTQYRPTIRVSPTRRVRISIPFSSREYFRTTVCKKEMAADPQKSRARSFTQY